MPDPEKLFEMAQNEAAQAAWEAKETRRRRAALMAEADEHDRCRAYDREHGAFGHRDHNRVRA